MELPNGHRMVTADAGKRSEHGAERRGCMVTLPRTSNTKPVVSCYRSRMTKLAVNTATNIVTFLMVFLIQNSQNRDARALHLKLGQIIRSIQPAHNQMFNIEKLSEKNLGYSRKDLRRSVLSACLECLTPHVLTNIPPDNIFTVTPD